MIGVYGAGGFIGRSIVRHLARQGRPVRAIMRSTPPEMKSLASQDVEINEADFEDSLAMASSLIGVDTVIQLISTSSPGLGNSQAVYDIQHNVIPHIRFMKSCADAGVKRYIFISSGGTVYGPTTVHPIDENHPTNPISSHGLTKLTTEKYLQMQCHDCGMEYAILRLANAFGPGQTFRKGQGLIPAVLQRHARGEPIAIIGSGKARRDYVYIDDIAAACIAAVDATGPLRDVINIGSGESRSVLEVLEAMESILQTRFERNHIEARRSDVDINQLDIHRAAKIFGWIPQVPFEQGLQIMLSTYREGL